MIDWKESLKAAAKELGLLKKKHPPKKKVKTSAKTHVRPVKKEPPAKQESSPKPKPKSTKRPSSHPPVNRAPRVFSKDGVHPLHQKRSPQPVSAESAAEDPPMSSRVRRALDMSRHSAPRPMAGYDDEEPVRSVHALGQRWNRFDLHGFHY